MKSIASGGYSLFTITEQSLSNLGKNAGPTGPMSSSQFIKER